MIHPKKITTYTAPLSSNRQVIGALATLGVVLGSLLAGCVSDTQLLAQNSQIAQQTAEKKAKDELGCTQVKSSILNKKQVPSTPLGFLYSQYQIQVNGCGKQASYTVECRDEKLCYFARR